MPVLSSSMCDQGRTLAWNVGQAKLLRETREAKSSSLIFHQRHLRRCFSRNLLSMIRIAAASKSDKLTPMMVSHAE